MSGVFLVCALHGASINLYRAGSIYVVAVSVHRSPSTYYRLDTKRHTSRRFLGITHETLSRRTCPSSPLVSTRDVTITTPVYYLQVSSSRLRQDQERPRPFYGKDAWTGVHRRRSADAAAGEVSNLSSRYSPASSSADERKKQGNTKLSYEKVAWTWSDRRRNFSTGLGAASPVAASPLLRDETKSRSYAKSSWEKGTPSRSSKPLQVCMYVYMHAHIGACWRYLFVLLWGVLYRTPVAIRRCLMWWVCLLLGASSVRVPWSCLRRPSVVLFDAEYFESVDFYRVFGWWRLVRPDVTQGAPFFHVRCLVSLPLVACLSVSVRVRRAPLPRCPRPGLPAFRATPRRRCRPPPTSRWKAS